MPSRDAERPVAFFANALGDHVLTMPTVSGLAHVFPERLTLVAQRGRGREFFGHLPIERIVEIDVPSAPGGRSFDSDELGERLADSDLFLSLNPWHGPAMSVLLERFRGLSVGFFPGFQRQLPLDFSKHSADLAFDIVRAIAPELRLEQFAVPPPLNPVASTFAADLRRTLGARRLLVVHNETKADKMWSRDRLTELLRRLADDWPEVFVIVLGERDPGVHSGRLPDSSVVACGLPRQTAMAVVAASDGFLGVDSFLLHVADLWRVPGVGLFGPTRPHEFGFRFTGHSTHLDGGGSMDAIDVDAVHAAISAWYVSSGVRGESVVRN
jgi:hypothetical protein